MNFFLPIVVDPGLEDMCFQQDGATCDIARDTMRILKDAFPARVTSRFGHLAWSARSPDLTVTDFFFWGYLKSLVFAKQSPQFEGAEIVNVTPQMLRIVVVVVA